MSDIHISKWKPERGRALRRALGHSLKLINPAVVLITGDLTDAKNKESTASYQYEEEWIEYRDSLQKVVDESGIPLRRFNDLRGNHDKYGVPPSSKLDYFSKYSISAALNRSSLVQSVTVEGRDGQKLLFVGFDDSMTVGLRSPSNSFGHPTDELLAQLDMQLRRWDDAEGVTKIVYGHYPMSFTTSTESGKRPEEFMANNGVAAYLCGHLHTKFGRRLYKRHKTRNGEFWEWEVGDWRTSRMLRVLAVDNGDTSFVDLELIPPADKSEEYVMPTFILQTHPLDSRFMLPSSAKAVPSNSIRALVFSEAIPISVMARIYEFTTKRSPKLVNETSMKLFKKGQRGAYYYTAPWQSERFGQSSGRLKYAMQIIVEDNKGSMQHSDMRFFSVEGKPGEFHLAPLAFMFFGFPWERVFPVLLWSMISFLVSCLVIPKVFLHQLQKRGGYGEWFTSVFTPASTTWEGLVKIAKVPFWVMVEGARNRLLWAGMSTYMVFLILFPWFSGRILGDDYPLGHMSLRGWTGVQPSPSGLESFSGLGVPDIMGIVLPYVYEVVFPLLLLLSALAAERVVCEFHRTRLEKLLHKKNEIHTSESSLSRTADHADNDDSLSKDREVTDSNSKEETQAESGSPFSERKGTRHDDHCRLCKRFVRRGLVLGCVLVAYNHWRLCSAMLEAYGPMALVAAPAYAWGVPALLMITIFQTSKIRSKPPRHEQ